jgi:hypothetical protein
MSDILISMSPDSSPEIRLGLPQLLSVLPISTPPSQTPTRVATPCLFTPISPAGALNIIAQGQADLATVIEIAQRLCETIRK